MSQDNPQPNTPSAQDTPQDAKSMFRESIGIYVVVFLLVLILALSALGVGIIAANLYALVAIVFIGVPYYWMGKKHLDHDAFGLTTKQWPKHVAWGLLATLLTVIPFAAGQYFWETQIRQRHANHHADNYAHWPIELEGQPKQWGKKPGMWVWSQKNNLYIGIRGAPKRQHKLLLEAQAPFTPIQLGGVLMRRVLPSGKLAKGPLKPGKKWEVIPKWHHKPVTLIVRPAKTPGATSPKKLTLTQKPITANAKPWPVFKGPEGKPVKTTDPLTLKRGYMWIILWVVTQLFFIALPEEYFYRGYLQTRLEQAFEARDGKVRQWLGITPAIVVTSLLFGLGHLLIPVQGVLLGTRFSVFFPSLLFGWLRRRTGSIIAPTVYHAGCNLMVLFLGTHYF